MMNAIGDNTTHVMDIGQETYKMGHAGVETPTVFEKTDIVRGDKVNNCMKLSLIHDLESYTEILSSSLRRMSDGESNSNTPLLIIENVFENKESKKYLIKEVFENDMCSGVLFMNSAVTDCFSYGKSTGLMVRLTGGSLQVVPVIDGYALSGSISTSLGGTVLTKYAYNLLLSKSEKVGTDLLVPRSLVQEKEKVCLEEQPKYTLKEKRLSKERYLFEQLEIARDFKETVAYVGVKKQTSLEAVGRSPKYYEFPTGFHTRVYLERSKIPEMYFSPESYSEFLSLQEIVPKQLDPSQNFNEVNLQSLSVQGVVRGVLDNVDPGYRDVLLSNVYLSGGGSLVPGLAERLQSTLEDAFQGSRVKVNSDKRQFSTFFGGSIFGSLGATASLMISKADFEECGPSILSRKKCDWIK